VDQDIDRMYLGTVLHLVPGSFVLLLLFYLSMPYQGSVMGLTLGTSKRLEQEDEQHSIPVVPPQLSLGLECISVFFYISRLCTL
jgi:hypothetical protein